MYVKIMFYIINYNYLSRYSINVLIITKGKRMTKSGVVIREGVAIE